MQFRPYEAARNTVCIEDPFDALDNPGRSLALTTVDFVADEFLDAAQYIKALRDEQRAWLTIMYALLLSPHQNNIVLSLRFLDNRA